MGIYIGLDIGGTKILAASAGEDGDLLQEIRRETPLDLNQGLELLKNLTTQLAGDEKILGIGAAIGGPLDWEKGIVSPLHQPEWRNVPLKQIMEDTCGCPFFVDVDTNVAALGEYAYTDHRAARLLYLTVSTGMGGGFLLDGNIYRGARGRHPEVGHQSINYRCSYPEMIACACGAGDCLEALVSGNGIRRIYQRAPEELSESEWEEVAYNLGQGIRNLAAIYTPDIVVLGGGVALGRGNRLILEIRRVLKAHLKIVPIPEVYLSSLGEKTALMGAIALAQKSRLYSK